MKNKSSGNWDFSLKASQIIAPYTYYNVQLFGFHGGERSSITEANFDAGLDFIHFTVVLTI